MLWIASAILFVQWGLGLASGADLGGWVHLFLGLSFLGFAFAALREVRP